MPNSLPPAQTYKSWLFQVDKTGSLEYKVSFWIPDGKPLMPRRTFVSIDDAQAWAYRFIDQLQMRWIGFQVMLNPAELHALTSKLNGLASSLPNGEKVILVREMLPRLKMTDGANLKKASAALKLHVKALRSWNKPLKLYVQIGEEQSPKQREEFWFRILSKDLRLNPSSLEPQRVWEYVHCAQADEDWEFIHC